MKWITPVLLIIGVAHVLLGLYGLYSPDAVAELVGVEMTSVGARGEMRAAFGGLIAALGVAVLRGAMGGAAARAWLFAVATAYVGLAAGRLVSLGMDGVSAHTLFGGLLEGGLAVVLFWAGMERGSAAKAVPASAPPTPAPAAPAAEPAVTGSPKTDTEDDPSS